MVKAGARFVALAFVQESIPVHEMQSRPALYDFLATHLATCFSYWYAGGAALAGNGLLVLRTIDSGQYQF